MRLRSPQAGLSFVLLAGLVARVGYVLALPGGDPGWDRPTLDGAYYLEWATALAQGGSGPSGAFYLAPLYPYLLAGFLKLFGANLRLLFFLQEAGLVATAGLLSSVAWKRAGSLAGGAAAALVLLYHPAMFFAARPVGESLALLVLAGALALAERPSLPPSLGGGVLGAFAALARPNLLLVPLAWTAGAAVSKRWGRAAILAGAVAVVLLPVAWRNARASGHWVPISSNGGMTFFHGNGPGATGAFTPPRGLSGKLDTQRQEATALARLQGGRTFDDVEADGWWGRAALDARLADPAGTARLIAWRSVLFLDNYELGLDYAPELDANPWRWSAPVPFALLLGLAGLGVVLAGWTRTGGLTVWPAIAAGAAAPIAFYAACRYRLPAAVLLSIPAGVGVATAHEAWRARRFDRRFVLALGAGGALAVVSLLVPSAELARWSEAGALSNRAETLRRAGDLEAAEASARAAIARDPDAVAARFQLGVLLETRGRREEAEQVYHDALDRDPGQAAVAANLSRLLLDRDRPDAAIELLREALRVNPIDTLCWNNLVVALAVANRRDEAIAAWREADGRGVAMNPELRRALEGAGGAP